MISAKKLFLSSPRPLSLTALLSAPGYAVDFGVRKYDLSYIKNLRELYFPEIYSSPVPALNPGEGWISPSAQISPDAQVAATAIIGADVVVSPGAKIGSGALIGDGSLIGPEVTIGAEAVLACNNTVHGKVTIGARVLVGQENSLGQRHGSLIIPDHTFILNNNKIAGGLLGLNNIILSHNIIGPGVDFSTAVFLGSANHIAAGSALGRGVMLYGKAKIGRRVKIDSYTVFEEGLALGNDCHIGNHIYFGKNVKIGGHSYIGGAGLEYGDDVIIGPGSKLYSCSVGDRVTIGKNCSVAAGIALGADCVLANNVALERTAPEISSINRTVVYDADTLDYLPPHSIINENSPRECLPE